MKLPWKEIAAVADRILRKRQEPSLPKCPIDGTTLIQVRGSLHICSRGHRYGPDEPRGELINQGDHRGPI